MALFSQRQNTALRESTRRAKRPSAAAHILAEFVTRDSQDSGRIIEEDDDDTGYGKLLTVTDAQRPTTVLLRQGRGSSRNSRSSSNRTSMARCSIIDLALDTDIIDHYTKRLGVDEEPTSFCGRLKHLYDRLHLKHIVPFLILVIYSLIGAAIFYWIEYEHEQKTLAERQEEVDVLRRQVMDSMRIILGNSVTTEETKLMETRDTLDWYERELKKHPTHSGDKLRWDFWGALFYVGTIYTTIGFGNIAPRTTTGRVMTIVYAFFGVPLVLAIVNNIGKHLCVGITRLWKAVVRACTRCCVHLGPIGGSKRDLMLIKLQRMERGGAADEDDDEIGGGSEYSDDESETMPISVSLLISVLYLLSCAGLFCIWETKWTYFESFYFFCISLSTIGLGDVVPRKPKFLIFGFMLVIVGLSIVAMIINVIQIRIEEWLFRVMRMIQEEYAKAMEMEDSPERELILQNIMKKQPFFARNIVPQLMTQRQTEQLVQHVEKTASKYFNSKETQTANNLNTTSMGTATDPAQVDDFGMSYKVPSREKATQREAAPLTECWVQTEFPSTRDQSQQVLPDDFESIVGSAECSPPMTPIPPPFKPRLSRQAHLKLSEPDFTSQWSIPEGFFDLPADVSDMGVQTQPEPTQSISSQTSVEPQMAARRLVHQESKVETEEAAIQTAPVGVKDVCGQTIDSYLKVAKRLEILRTNRTDSLHIMATGPMRKSSAPPPQSPSPSNLEPDRSNGGAFFGNGNN